jgi:hypothetical protein
MLFEKGFTEGTCGHKVKKLEAAIAAGTAPKELAAVESSTMKVLAKLGNGAVHVNDGDVGRQAALDGALLAAIALTFEQLLRTVYERPIEDDELKAKLDAAVAALDP